MRRTNIRLDDQAREDAQQIAKEYGLGSASAAVRFALREIAKRLANVATNVADTQRDPPPTA
jgi:antitoxin component of RelBE/YafQ-DinJ toxin-antitoxin module